MGRSDEPYADNLALLGDELAWLDVVVELAVLCQQAATDRTGGGLAISEEAVAGMLGRRPPPVNTAKATALLREIDSRRETISGRVAASGAAGVALRLPRLVDLFSLSPFERDVLVVCLAIELDAKYERLYGYLHDDVTRRAPSVELIFRLLCHDARQRVLARTSFLASSPLYRYALLEDVAGERGRPLAARAVKLDDAIAHHLLGGADLDARLAPCVRLVVPKPSDGAGENGEHGRLSAALERYLGEPTADQWLAAFHGPDRTAQDEAARVACGAVGVPLLRVDLEALGERESFDRDVRLVFREAALRGAAVLLDGGDGFARDGDKGGARARAIDGAMVEMGWITFVAGARAWEPADVLKRQRFFTWEFTVPAYLERRRLWHAELNGEAPAGPNVDVDEIAAQFRFTRSEIKNAASIARTLARLRADGAGGVGQNDLQTACRAESNPGLLHFGRKVRARPGWDDLVLPAEQKTQLGEIVDYIRHHEAVYSAWGFGEKYAMGRGTNVLFSGPSGTGKTMTAAIMAGELGLDLYQIDLSTVVSKYIGETEKNLSRVFREAETSNAMLFFDEADALFGRRSEVKDAHDRYANIEVNYLLQKMEEHEGIVVLATNFSKNVDEAFLRRLHFAVLFPFPEKDERLQIWRGVFPVAAPLAGDVDLEFLARRFKIAGGSIKNIALGAAFLAQSEGEAIGMRQIILATKREFQKMGKICAKADFGDFYALVT